MKKIILILMLLVSLTSFAEYNRDTEKDLEHQTECIFSGCDIVQSYHNESDNVDYYHFEIEYDGRTIVVTYEVEEDNLKGYWDVK